MTTWRDEGTYEVERGQVWRVGKHLYHCGDATQLDGSPVFEQLLEEVDPEMVYADPPWSDAQAKQFRTLAKLPPPEYSWIEVFRAVVELTDERPLWLVSDSQRADMVWGLLRKPHYGRWLQHDFNSPNVTGVLHYSASTAYPDGSTELVDVKDQVLPRRIMELYEGERSILDFCGGLGITSRCAEKLGWRSLTNEYSPPRMGAALARMEKLCGDKPIREV